MSAEFHCGLVQQVNVKALSVRRSGPIARSEPGVKGRPSHG
jgi:hypothetical protein